MSERGPSAFTDGELCPDGKFGLSEVLLLSRHLTHISCL